MEFSVADRLNLMDLLSVYPEKASAVTFRIVGDLQRELSFSEEELVAVGLEKEGNRITWDAEKAEVKEVEVGPKALEVVRGILQDLDQKEKLPRHLVGLYGRFCSDE